MVDISVVIPTYNYGRYLPAAIDSVLAQDDVQVELIVVDDGSTDDTRERLAPYGDRIRILGQENQGAPTARNHGLREACGEFVLFLDADDRLEPGALSSRLHYLRQHPECDWVYGPWAYRDEEGHDVTASFDRYPFAYRHARQGWVLPYLLLGELIHTSCVMARGEVLRDLGGFRLDLPVLQDYELWLRLAAAGRAGFIAECNIVVVTHPDSISRGTRDNYRTLLLILQDAEERYPKVVRLLGRMWRKRISRILLERAAHLMAEGDAAGARGLLVAAVGKDCLHLKAYVYLLKSWLKRGG